MTHLAPVGTARFVDHIVSPVDRTTKPLLRTGPRPAAAISARAATAVAIAERRVSPGSFPKHSFSLAQELAKLPDLPRDRGIPFADLASQINVREAQDDAASRHLRVRFPGTAGAPQILLKEGNGFRVGETDKFSRRAILRCGFGDQAPRELRAVEGAGSGNQ